MLAGRRIPRRGFPNHYITVNCYNAQYTKQPTALPFSVNRPKVKSGFRLNRTEMNDRHIAYTLHSYAAEKPHGTRYQENGEAPSVTEAFQQRPRNS